MPGEAEPFLLACGQCRSPLLLACILQILLQKIRSVRLSAWVAASVVGQTIEGQEPLEPESVVPVLGSEMGVGACENYAIPACPEDARARDGEMWHDVRRWMTV